MQHRRQRFAPIIVIMLFIIGLVVTIWSFGNTWLKARLTSLIEAQIGHHLTIGHLQIWFLPTPRVVMEDIHVDPSPTPAFPLISARRAFVQLPLRPLLHQQIDLQKISLTQPTFLITDSFGAQLRPLTHGDTQQDRRGWSVALSTIDIKNGVFHWQPEGHEERIFYVKALHFHKLQSQKPLLDSTGSYNEHPLSLNGNTNAIAQWGDRLALQLNLTATQPNTVPTTLNVRGTLSPHTHVPNYDVTIFTRTENPSIFNAFLAPLSLPPTSQLTVQSHLAGPFGQVNVQSGHLNAQNVRLDHWKKDTVLDKIDLDTNTPTSPVRAQFSGQMQQSPFTAQLMLAPLQTLTPQLLAGTARPETDLLSLRVHGQNLWLTPWLNQAYLNDITLDSGGPEEPTHVQFNGRYQDAPVAAQLRIDNVPALMHHFDEGTLLSHLNLQALHVHAQNFSLAQWMNHSSLTDLTLNADTPSAPAHIDMTGNFDGNLVTTNGTLGSLQILTPHFTKETVPLNVIIKEGTTHLHAQGHLNADHSDMTIDGSLARLPLKSRASDIENIHLSTDVETGQLEQLLHQSEAIHAFRRLTINGKAHIGTLNWQGASWHNVQGHFKAQKGHLTIDPVTAFGANQRQAGYGTYDLSSDIPHYHVAARSLFVPLAALRPTFHLTPHINGDLQIVGDIQSEGQTRDEFLHHLNGHMGLSMVNGHIGRDFLIHFLKVQLPTFSVHVPESCMGTHLNINNGQSSLDELGMQVLSLRLQGEGQVNLTSHMMHVILESELNLIGPRTLPTFVEISGPWETASATVVPAGIQYPIPAVTSGDYCASLLQKTREGQSGPAPDLANTTTRGVINKSIAKGLGVKQKDVERGENALGLGLDILGASDGNTGEGTAGNMLDSFGL